jgi:hypothetical protein
MVDLAEFRPQLFIVIERVENRNQIENRGHHPHLFRVTLRMMLHFVRVEIRSIVLGVLVTAHMSSIRQKYKPMDWVQELFDQVGPKCRRLWFAYDSEHPLEANEAISSTQARSPGREQDVLTRLGVSGSGMVDFDRTQA